MSRVMGLNHAVSLLGRMISPSALPHFPMISSSFWIHNSCFVYFFQLLYLFVSCWFRPQILTYFCVHNMPSLFPLDLCSYQVALATPLLTSISNPSNIHPPFYFISTFWLLQIGVMAIASFVSKYRDTKEGNQTPPQIQTLRMNIFQDSHFENKELLLSRRHVKEFFFGVSLGMG